MQEANHAGIDAGKTNVGEGGTATGSATNKSWSLITLLAVVVSAALSAGVTNMLHKGSSCNAFMKTRLPSGVLALPEDLDASVEAQVQQSVSDEPGADRRLSGLWDCSFGNAEVAICVLADYSIAVDWSERIPGCYPDEEWDFFFSDYVYTQTAALYAKTFEDGMAANFGRATRCAVVGPVSNYESANTYGERCPVGESNIAAHVATFDAFLVCAYSFGGSSYYYSGYSASATSAYLDNQINAVWDRIGQIDFIY